MNRALQQIQEVPERNAAEASPSSGVMCARDTEKVVRHLPVPAIEGAG